jgi:hypothetical protein
MMRNGMVARHGLKVLLLAGVAVIAPHTAAANTPAGRYTITNAGLSTGTVTDTKTGLTWQQPVSPPATWSAAVAGCTGPWRLPSMKELATIVDESRTTPSAIDPVAFPNTPPAFFWSSSVHGTGIAYYVDFATGNIVYQSETTLSAYRCVQ